MKLFRIILFLLINVNLFAQTIPSSRTVDWTIAGLRDTTTFGFAKIDMAEEGVFNDGKQANDHIIPNILSTIFVPGVIFEFPEGEFLFNEPIQLPNNVIIRGQGSEKTIFKMDLGGSGHAIQIQGSTSKSDTTYLISSAIKDSSSLSVANIASFTSGNWIQIIQEDSDLVTSSWAEKKVGQIVQIKEIIGTTIYLESPLRMTYDMSRNPYIQKLIPIENVGIECLKIHRIDDTAPQQSSNIAFIRAANCWVKGVESENCTFSHLRADHSSNLHISQSYFHHAFNYGGGGRAYGVMLQATSNECLVENNVFEHLRHSMILQSGANGNVFAYNYSFDPFWESTPKDAAGDMVLHGNYPYANLFEQNICQNIIIDNSHGPNGPYNTIFRNRAQKFGIFFSAKNSPSQNIVGNEITNTSSPYHFVNYTIKGKEHFLHGNNNKGTIHPKGTNELEDLSYAYSERPTFVPSSQWAGIGTPQEVDGNTIPAFDQFEEHTFFSNGCNNMLTNTTFLDEKDSISIFPNPIYGTLTIKSNKFIRKITIFNSLGQIFYAQKNIGKNYPINTFKWKTGVYYFRFELPNEQFIMKKAVKLY